MFQCVVEEVIKYDSSCNEEDTVVNLKDLLKSFSDQGALLFYVYHSSPPDLLCTLKELGYVNLLNEELGHSFWYAAVLTDAGKALVECCCKGIYD